MNEIGTPLHESQSDGLSAKASTEVNSTGPPPEVERVLNKISQERGPRVVEEVLAMGMSQVGNPLHQKMTAEHITQVLELAKLHDERQYNLTKQANDNDDQQKTSSRRYFFWSFVVIVALAVLIIIVFRNQPTILMPAITGLGGFVGGIAAGYGIGRQKTN
jgi:uncharacterized membrane protein YdfJ with MMPL/SSD domain